MAVEAVQGVDSPLENARKRLVRENILTPTYADDVALCDELVSLGYATLRKDHDEACYFPTDKVYDLERELRGMPPKVRPLTVEDYAYSFGFLRGQVENIARMLAIASDHTEPAIIRSNYLTMAKLAAEELAKSQPERADRS